MSSALIVVKRFWVALVIVIAVLVAFVVVSRLRGFFGTDLPAASTGTSSDAIVAFHSKRVRYDVLGPAATSGHVSYLDATGQTREASFTTLPWSVTVTTTDPGMLANVVAQGDADTLGCRITVNDAVNTEQYFHGRDTPAFCLDKSA